MYVTPDGAQAVRLAPEGYSREENKVLIRQLEEQRAADTELEGSVKVSTPENVCLPFNHIDQPALGRGRALPTGPGATCSRSQSHHPLSYLKNS